MTISIKPGLKGQRDAAEQALNDIGALVRLLLKKNLVSVEEIEETLRAGPAVEYTSHVEASGKRRDEKRRAARLEMAKAEAAAKGKGRQKP